MVWLEMGPKMGSWRARGIPIAPKMGPEMGSWRARGAPRAPDGSSFSSGADGASERCPKWVPKWGPIASLETVAYGPNLQKRESRKGTRFWTSFGTSFGLIWSAKMKFLGRRPELETCVKIKVSAFKRVLDWSSQRNR